MNTGFMDDQPATFPQTSAQLRAFMNGHLGRLTHHACHVLGDRDEAEDVVQETIIWEEKSLRIRLLLDQLRKDHSFGKNYNHSAFLNLKLRLLLV